jgi:hypothetical protein
MTVILAIGGSNKWKALIEFDFDFGLGYQNF